MRLNERSLVKEITALPAHNSATGEWNASPTGNYLWSNVNFGEAVPGVMTPLSWTVLKLIFGEWALLPGYDAVGNIGGRPYLNISLFASLLSALGKSRRDLLETLEGTLYLRLPDEVEIPLIPLTRWFILSHLPALVRTRWKEWSGVKGLPAYLNSNPAQCDKRRERIRQVKTGSALSTLWREEIRPHVTATVWHVMGSVSSSTAYTMKLRRELLDLVGPDDANVLISSVSDRSAQLASLGPVIGIAQVAQGEMDAQTYLERFGHRGPHEFELSVPRPAEDPRWFEEKLAQFRASPVDVEALLEKQHAVFNAAWDRFQARFPRKAKVMRRRIDEAARRARLREAARSEYVRDRWLVRAFALRAGELTGLGNDVFFLTIDEVQAVLTGDETALPSISNRKETFEQYKGLPSYPSIILGRFDPFQWAADPHRRSDIFKADGSLQAEAAEMSASRFIHGSPGSAGIVEGTVRRLDRPEDGDQLKQGEVLVTMQTDIAWTLLFPRAAAVVTDVGALLSHAAIVARELGIPAVVGCGDATMRLNTGDRVSVNGGRGMVEILESIQNGAS